MKANSESKNQKNTKPPGDFWELRLYVAGQTSKSIEAFANLKKICEENLKGKYTIEVIDLLKNPQLAKGDQILAIPTLVRKLPAADQEDHRRLSPTPSGFLWASISGRASDIGMRIIMDLAGLAPCGLQFKERVRT